MQKAGLLPVNGNLLCMVLYAETGHSGEYLSSDNGILWTLLPNWFVFDHLKTTSKKRGPTIMFWHNKHLTGEFSDVTTKLDFLDMFKDVILPDI